MCCIPSFSTPARLPLPLARFPPNHTALMTSPQRKPPLLKAPHLLGIAELSPSEIVSLLDLADTYVEVNRQIDKRHALLSGRTQVNLFFENSTRTQSSFEIA